MRLGYTKGLMKIIVQAKPRSKRVSVERLTQPTLTDDADSREQVETLDVYKVCVSEQPVDGKANQAIIKALAEYFNVAPSLVRLMSGPASKHKIFEIDL